MAVSVGLALLGAAVLLFCYSRGWTLYYGDAEAHLNIARRIVDSQTPGYDQLGTVWLPLPHVLMLPLVRMDGWWQRGIAGAVPASVCFVIAGSFLFATVRRVFGSVPAAVAATALLVLNPNLLYLQSTPMTEPVFIACLMALLYFSVCFRESQSLLSVIGAAVSACAATLTRYDGWFLLPFAAAYFFLTAERRRVATIILFCVLAGLGPLYWFGHNWWLTGDALDFYRGPYSAHTIQGDRPYPGKNDWGAAWFYYRNAIQFCSGIVLVVMALPGAVAALAKRAFWPLFLLILPPVFYVWSLHSSGTPIFVPNLWPHSYYNSRYGLVALPLLAFASAALVAVAPVRMRALAACLVIAAGGGFWVLHPQPRNWVTFQESVVNSEARREWTRQAADYLAPVYVRGSGIVTSFGDLSGIFRQAGIPLRETFTGDNGLPWEAAMKRPRLFLWQEWGVAMAGDSVDRALSSDARLYRLEKSILVKGAPEIHIYRRTGGSHGNA